MFIVTNYPVVARGEVILTREFNTLAEAVSFACDLYQYICYGGYRSEYVVVKDDRDNRTVSRMVYHHPRPDTKKFDRNKQLIGKAPLNDEDFGCF